ncbi:MAG: exo-alpha-sialidase [Ruminococcaceae bacterium]|nr:exo-alpha-sialidase [Oscillospiraceae bacterium]
MGNRNIRNGREIRADGYSDQPYVVKTDDGHWLLTVTVCNTREGESGQHVLSMISCDKGLTWCDETPVSSPDLPESSYSVLYKTSYGRVYCFYNFNADNTRRIIGTNPPFSDGFCRRVDTQGHFVFKYSDDNGKTWSQEWYELPVRTFDVDRINPYKGEIKFFWNVGKPMTLNNSIYLPLIKVREFGVDFICYSEGVLLKCENINSERDPEKLVWETLPDGNVGIRAPQELGIVSEEHSYVPLSDGSIFCVFRTTTGHPWCAYSRDGGHTFSDPEPMKFADGRLFKHPRAANFIWKCENGKYIYWFHNHGGRNYDDRNPVWLCGAKEVETPDGLFLSFGEPQIVLYDPNPNVRMSYPDLVEEDGEYFLTETQKTVARVHPLDKKFVESLWETPAPCDGWKKVSASELSKKSLAISEHSLTFRFDVCPEDKGNLLFSTMDYGKGIEIRRRISGEIELIVSDGQRTYLFINDDLLLTDDKKHTVTAVFDSGVAAVYFATDGRFCDGGDKRQFGFTRFDRELKNISGLSEPSVNKLENFICCSGIHLYD